MTTLVAPSLSHDAGRFERRLGSCNTTTAKPHNQGNAVYLIATAPPSASVESAAEPALRSSLNRSHASQDSASNPNTTHSFQHHPEMMASAGVQAKTAAANAPLPASSRSPSLPMAPRALR